jgi:hypothetical protein
VDIEEWIELNAARVRQLLDDPTICTEVAALMTGNDYAARRRRRQRELECELAEMEVRWIRRGTTTSGSA